MYSDKKYIILFDGVCNLCNSSINFLIKRDKHNHFLFTSLQSDVAKKLLLQLNDKNNWKSLDSILLIKNNTIYSKSSAILHILFKMHFPYKLLYVFFIIPKFIRDYVYDIIAKNRYSWFGKRDTCMLPTKEYLDKFL